MQQFLNNLFTGFGMPEPISVALTFLILAGLLFFLFSVVGQVAVVFMVLMERKILAWLTQRKGPNRVGPFGLLQTVADGVKLLFKEDIMTPQQDKILFTLAPVIFFAPSFVIYALIPFTDQLLGINLSLGLLFVFALSSLSSVGIVLAGWASNNKYSLLGGMRSASQAISYEIPLVMSAMAVALAAGTLNIREIVEAQNGASGMFSWFAFSLLPLGFFIFWTSSIAEVNRVPFDLPEAESELVSGYNTEYSGMKFAMFFLAEYASLFGMSALLVMLFFGGYYSPLGGLVLERFLGIREPLLLQLEMATWVMLKTYIFIALAMLIRGTLPRLKPDQLMGFCWKFLIPLSLVNLFVVAGLKLSWLSGEPTVALGPLRLSPIYLVGYLVAVVVVFTVLFAFGRIFKRKNGTHPALQQRTV